MSHSASTIQCPSCGAHVPVPPELAMLTAPCPYCRTAILLPDQPARQAAVERMQERSFQEQMAQQAAAQREREQKRSRGTLLLVLGCVALGGLGTIGGIVYVIHKATTPAPAPRPIDPTLAGQPQMIAKVEERQKAGCAHIVTPPGTFTGTMTSTYRLTNAVCFEMLATTGAPAQTLTLRLVGPSGKELQGAPSPGQSLQYQVCPKEPGEHQVQVSAPAGTPFTFAALDCPRPSFDNPTGNGQARVSAIMKERYATGCREIIMPPKTISVDQDIKGDFHPGSCVLIIGATGSSKNLLTLELSTPFGEKIATPAPSTELTFLYCPKVSGPHEGHVRSAEGDPFTVAAVTCPLSARR
jgi:hypothetical protein